MILVARGKYIGTRLLRPAVQLTTQPPTTWTYSAWYSACVALCWSSSGARGPLSTARSSATRAHEPQRTPSRCSAASCSRYRQSSCPIYRTRCPWACLGSIATEQTEARTRHWELTSSWLNRRVFCLNSNVSMHLSVPWRHHFSGKSGDWVNSRLTLNGAYGPKREDFP